MKLVIITFLLLFTNILLAQEDYQESYQYEVELGTDNDFLVFLTESDRYYTYGINATFRWLNERPIFLDKWFSKKIGYFQSVGLNIEAYTPDYEREGTETDRPYAGWSYAELDLTYGFEKSFLIFGLDLGVLGPDSQAGALQNWFHGHVTGDPVLPGWRNQIGNQFGFNVRGTYAQTLFARKNIDLYGVADVSLGNLFAYVNPGINFRLGKFNPLSQTAAFQNALLANTSNNELFMDLVKGVL